VNAGLFASKLAPTGVRIPNVGASLLAKMASLAAEMYLKKLIRKAA
jgi:hypothetical protein